MSLQELVQRLGIAEVARRARVSEGTLRDWLRRGPSRKGAEVLSGIIRRHLGSRKAAETKKQAEAFRGTVTTPPDTELPENKVKPPAPPSSDSIVDEGSRPYNTDRYTGEVHVFTIGQPIHEVDFDAIGRYVARVFVASGRHYVYARFLLFRYVTPGSPGKGGMVSARGKWSEFWISTHLHGSVTGIENEVATSVDEGTEMGKESLRELANRRVIWLEQIHVHTFDDNDNPTELATIATRELR